MVSMEFSKTIRGGASVKTKNKNMRSTFDTVVSVDHPGAFAMLSSDDMSTC